MKRAHCPTFLSLGKNLCKFAQNLHRLSMLSECLQDALLRRYQEEIRQLQSELDTAKSSQQDSGHAQSGDTGAESQSSTDGHGLQPENDLLQGTKLDAGLLAQVDKFTPFAHQRCFVTEWAWHTKCFIGVARCERRRGGKRMLTSAQANRSESECCSTPRGWSNLCRHRQPHSNPWRDSSRTSRPPGDNVLQLHATNPSPDRTC